MTGYGRRFAGACVDGPMFGRNLVADHPTWNVALPSPPLSLSAYLDQNIDDAKAVRINHVTYVWREALGVWAVSSQPVSHHEPEPEGYPSVRKNWGAGSLTKVYPHVIRIQRTRFATKQQRSDYIRRHTHRLRNKLAPRPRPDRPRGTTRKGNQP